MLKYQQDLRLQLLSLYLIFVALIFSIALIVYWRETDFLQRQIQDTNAILAQAIANETNNQFLQAKHAAITFAVMPSIINGDSSEIDAMLVGGEFISQNVNQITRISANGAIEYNYPPESNSTNTGEGIPFDSYFEQLRKSGEHLFSDIRLYPQKNTPVIISGIPIFRDKVFDGVVTINFELDQLDESLSAINQQRTSTNQVDILIIDSQQRIMASSYQAPLLETVDELRFLDNGWPTNTISFVKTDTNGVEWLYTYSPIPSAEWLVIVKHRTQLAFAPLINFRNGLFSALLIFGLGAFLFWIFLSQRVISPLERLTRYGESIDQRVLGTHRASQSITPISHRPDQMGRLTQTLMQAETSIRRRLAELTTLNKTSTAVLSSLDAEEVIETILDEVQRLLQVSQCAILMDNGSGNELRIHASRGLSNQFLSFLEDTGANTLPAFWAIHENKPIQVSDIFTEQYTHLWPLAKLGSYRSLLAIPLTSRHGKPAALVIYRSNIYHFTPEEVDLATNFANHAAIALEHALLFRMTDIELQKQVRFLSALNRVGHTVSQSLVMDEILANAIDTVFEITESDECWIFLNRADDPLLRLRAQRGLSPNVEANFKDKPLRCEDTIPEFVVQRNQSLRLSTASLPISSWEKDPLISNKEAAWLAAVPLRAKSTTIGALGMVTHRTQIYSENEMALLESIGDQIAIAVVNARLYNRSREMATLEERNRVAREIHDTIIQSLTGILVHLQGIKRLKEKRPDQVAGSLDDALMLAQNSLREARRSVLNLRPLALETLTLDQAIAIHLERFAQQGGFESQFVLEGFPTALENDVEQHLYRILQESLNNIIRHAQATEVNVQLTYAVTKIILSITDNGIGLHQDFVPTPYYNTAQHPSAQGGFGLIGIQERARLIGGEVAIQPLPSNGTQIKVVIPR